MDYQGAEICGSKSFASSLTRWTSQTPGMAVMTAPLSGTEEAALLSQASYQAMSAARSILLAGGSQATALSTAKAAANSVLTQSYSTTNGNGTPKVFLHKRKAKRQAEVIASMALVTMANSVDASRMNGVGTEHMRAHNHHHEPSIPLQSRAAAAAPAAMATTTHSSHHQLHHHSNSGGTQPILATHEQQTPRQGNGIFSPQHGRNGGDFGHAVFFPYTPGSQMPTNQPLNANNTALPTTAGAVTSYSTGSGSTISTPLITTNPQPQNNLSNNMPIASRTVATARLLSPLTSPGISITMTPQILPSTQQDGVTPPDQGTGQNAMMTQKSDQLPGGPPPGAVPLPTSQNQSPPQPIQAIQSGLHSLGSLNPSRDAEDAAQRTSAGPPNNSNLHQRTTSNKHSSNNSVFIRPAVIGEYFRRKSMKLKQRAMNAAEGQQSQAEYETATGVTAGDGGEEGGYTVITKCSTKIPEVMPRSRSQTRNLVTNSPLSDPIYDSAGAKGASQQPLAADSHLSSISSSAVSSADQNADSYDDTSLQSTHNQHGHNNALFNGISFFASLANVLACGPPVPVPPNSGGLDTMCDNRDDEDDEVESECEGNTGRLTDTRRTRNGVALYSSSDRMLQARTASSGGDASTLELNPHPNDAMEILCSLRHDKHGRSRATRSTKFMKVTAPATCRGTRPPQSFNDDNVDEEILLRDSMEKIVLGTFETTTPSYKSGQSSSHSKSASVDRSASILKKQDSSGYDKASSGLDGNVILNGETQQQQQQQQQALQARKESKLFSPRGMFGKGSRFRKWGRQQNRTNAE